MKNKKSFKVNISTTTERKNQKKKLNKIQDTHKKEVKQKKTFWDLLLVLSAKNEMKDDNY